MTTRRATKKLVVLDSLDREAKSGALKSAKPPSAAKKSTPKARKPIALPKSDGDAGVYAYIASLEPWQAAIAKRVDAIIAKNVRGVRRGMRWRCPFYGVEDMGYFLAFAAFQRHLKFTFFKGALLNPPPPLGKVRKIRSLDVRELDVFDEKLFARWVKQAAAIPGWAAGRGSE